MTIDIQNKCLTCVHAPVCMNNLGGADLDIVGSDCADYLPNKRSLKVKNLDIKFSEALTEQQVTEAIERGFAGVDFADNQPVYLIKVNVGDMRADQVFAMIKGLCEELRALGLTNCMFVPLCKNGIQDIEVIEVSNEGIQIQ